LPDDVAAVDAAELPESTDFTRRNACANGFAGFAGAPVAGVFEAFSEDAGAACVACAVGLPLLDVAAALALG
jgi:hypothetical protein